MHVFAFLGFSNFGTFNSQFFAFLVFSNFSIFSSLVFAFLGFSNFSIFSSQVLAILAAMAILAARFWHFQVLCNFFAYVFAQLSFFFYFLILFLILGIYRFPAPRIFFAILFLPFTQQRGKRGRSCKVLAFERMRHFCS